MLDEMGIRPSGDRPSDSKPFVYTIDAARYKSQSRLRQVYMPVPSPRVHPVSTTLVWNVITTELRLFGRGAHYAASFLSSQCNGVIV